jgi:hypothetical protein
MLIVSKNSTDDESTSGPTSTVSPAIGIIYSDVFEVLKAKEFPGMPGTIY